MSTSQITSLCKPKDGQPIPKGTLAYFRTRNRHRLYTLVMDEFERSGISQAELARRLGKTPDIICRWLAQPTNWTIDTVSDLLFAISGGEAKYLMAYPLDQPARNDTQPDWLKAITDSQEAGSQSDSSTSGAGLELEPVQVQ